MKIAAVLENSVTAGGGFNQALNAILQMDRLAKENFDFVVFSSVAENIPALEKLGIATKMFKAGWKDQLLSFCAINQFGRRVQNRLRLIGDLERKLMDDQVDLVYFVTPSARSLSLQKLNYISTVWDLCHRDTPEFPEVHEFNAFHSREWLFKNSLAPSLLVLTDSDTLSDRVARRYGVDSERLLAMPFLPSPLAAQSLSCSKAEVLSRYKLEEGYFFYPAQFWAHKNHFRVLEALLKLRQRGIALEVVFSGGDQGSLFHIERFINQNSLKDQVKILGFVPSEDIRALYEGCHAVVMPTYFGPTNLPPLEAWKIGKPLIYSAHLRAHVGDAAICVNPDDSVELADAMAVCLDSETSASLIRSGYRRLAQIELQRTQAEEILVGRIKQFEARLKCWR